MTIVDAHARPHTATEPRTVCLTFGPSRDLSTLLRSAAEVLDHAGVAPTTIEPTTTAAGVWLRVTCDVDPADVARLVALPALADHGVDHHVDAATAATERCPACELRSYLTALP